MSRRKAYSKLKKIELLLNLLMVKGINHLEDFSV